MGEGKQIDMCELEIGPSRQGDTGGHENLAAANSHTLLAGKPWCRSFLKGIASRDLDPHCSLGFPLCSHLVDAVKTVWWGFRRDMLATSFVIQLIETTSSA